MVMMMSSDDPFETTSTPSVLAFPNSAPKGEHMMHKDPFKLRISRELVEAEIYKSVEVETYCGKHEMSPNDLRWLVELYILETGLENKDLGISGALRLKLAQHAFTGRAKSFAGEDFEYLCINPNAKILWAFYNLHLDELMFLSVGDKTTRARIRHEGKKRAEHFLSTFRLTI